MQPGGVTRCRGTFQRSATARLKARSSGMLLPSGAAEQSAKISRPGPCSSAAQTVRSAESSPPLRKQAVRP